MPNITSTIPTQDVNPIPTSKTKKNKKSKKKNLAVNTETSNSNGLIEEQFSPITPATTENSEHENINKNPYMEVVYKRLRAMRKRMVKVEKCEEIVKSSPDGKNQLNADQLNSLEKKGELAAVIKQFEDILKSMEPVDKEEIKKEKAQKKAQQEENEKAISNATKKAKNEHTESIIFLLDFFRLVHFQQLNIVQLSDLESEAVETLRAKLTTMAEESKNEELKGQRIKDILDNVNKLQHSDENIIMNLFTNNLQDSSNKGDNNDDNSEQEITYSHVRSLIQSPPILETTEVQHEQEDSQDINGDTNDNINQEEFVIINREIENIADNNTANTNKSSLNQDEKLQIQSEIQTPTKENSQKQTAQESVQVTTENSINTVAVAHRVQIKQSFVPKQLGDTQPPPLTPRNQSNSNRGYRPTYRNNNNRTTVNNNGGYNSNNRGQSQRRENNNSYNSGNYNNSGYNNGSYHGGPRGRGSRVGQFRPRPPQ